MAIDKREIIAAMRRELEGLHAQRAAAAADPVSRSALRALKQFQSERMSATHADLLTARDTREAAEFFLSDLYGAQDMSQRDADLLRVLPMMEKLLPPSALRTVLQAVTLDALSERLDGAMAARLGAEFSERDYARAYRETTTRSDRELQLAHIRSLGEALAGLVEVPLLGTTLEMMRGPARLARLGALQRFLETGFRAFSKIRDRPGFVRTVMAREQAILENLFAGREQPFRPG